MIKDKSMEELFKSAQNGNMEAREAIVKENMGLVYSIAQKYKNKKSKKNKKNMIKYHGLYLTMLD